MKLLKHVTNPSNKLKHASKIVTLIIKIKMLLMFIMSSLCDRVFNVSKGKGIRRV